MYYIPKQRLPLKRDNVMYFNSKGGVYNHGNYIHTSNNETHGQVDLMNERNFHFNNNSYDIYIHCGYLLFNNMRVILFMATWLSFIARSTIFPCSTSSMMDLIIWLNSSVRGGRNDSKRLVVKSSIVQILRKWSQ